MLFFCLEPVTVYTRGCRLFCAGRRLIHKVIKSSTELTLLLPQVGSQAQKSVRDMPEMIRDCGYFAFHAIKTSVAGKDITLKKIKSSSFMKMLFLFLEKRSFFLKDTFLQKQTPSFIKGFFSHTIRSDLKAGRHLFGDIFPFIMETFLSVLEDAFSYKQHLLF